LKRTSFADVNRELIHSGVGIKLVVERELRMARIEIGNYLAADTRICGGRLILRGSRILVSDVLELTQAGYSPTAISRQYQGIISPEAVREAVSLTSRGIVTEIGRKKTAA
jgi:uncharacterized protein (DUF433 family)